MTQPIDYISIRRDFIDLLPSLPESAVKVFMVLVARNEAQKTLKAGLTFQELVRTADVGRHEAQRALDYLSMAVGNSDLGPFIQIVPKGKNHVIAVNEYWIGEEPTLIPFSFKDTDQTRIETIEKEMRRMELRLNRKTESGIVEVMKGETRDLLREVEKDKGIALDAIDGYLLGSAVRGYGTERVKHTYRRLRTNKNPIRAVYAALNRGAQGHGAKQAESEPFEKATYRYLDE
jgi:hypothetical protein